MKIKGRQLVFGDPRPADVLIFDEVNSEYVRKAINTQHCIDVFKTRPENIFIGPGVLINFLSLLPSIRLGEIKKAERGLFMGFLKQLKMVYFIACFKAINPKAIVTQIDNSTDFHWLSKNYRKFPFIAIQNGSRLSFMSNQIEGFYLQHFFCFGENEKQQFPRIGYTVENFYPVGSLIASLHYVKPQTAAHQYDILVLSTWRGNIGFPKDVQDTMRSMRIMDELIAKYLKQRKLRAAIILRAERGGQHWYIPEIGSNEEDYYRGIYGNSASILETDFKKRNIFPLMQQSEFIISCLSSALFEGFGIGKKALLCNFTGTDTYHLDFSHAIITTNSEFAAFAQKIDDLLNMPQKVYNSEYKELARYYMNFPEDDSATEEVIASQIDAIINTKKTA
jgi:surface carbohydrate biosynthesis protein